MKEITIILLIITLVVVGHVYVYSYLNTTSNSIIEELQSLNTNINKEEISLESLIEKSDDIKYKWNEIKETWSNIILHEEVDAIETALIRTKAKIETDEKEEAIEDIQTAIFLLEHIKEKEKVNLKNIF